MLGSRLDIRQTGSDLEGFSENKKIFQVDCDENELNARGICEYILNEDIYTFIQKLEILSGDIPKYSVWHTRLKELRVMYPDIDECNAEGEINPNVFLKLLSAKTERPTVYITDVGQHQMWAAQSVRLKPDDRFITSGGMGAMGFGLPAAIGIAFLVKNSCDVVLVTGDGGLQMNIQELQTVIQYNLNIKIFVINNKCLGMIRQFQETYFESNYVGSIRGYDAPDFCEIARAYGLDFLKINSEDSLCELVNFINQSCNSLLVDVEVSSSANVYPKLAFGKKHGSMEPDVSADKMR